MSWKEHSVHSLNPDEWQPSCCISPYSQLHHSPLKPAAHGGDFEIYLWYVMEIKENEMEKESSESWALYV